jgi:prepilin-type N-terminal cleavage/methylation domain-containing protein
MKTKRHLAAFTLIELLTVISIIAVIAAFVLTATPGLKKRAKINTATIELKQIELAVEDYQHKYGAYPPSNPNVSPLENTLYYELSGVTLTNGTYMTLDGAASILQQDYQVAFTGGTPPPASIDGVINCTKGSAEEGTKAQNFLSGLSQSRFAASSSGGKPIASLVTSVRGPDSNYQPVGVQDVNPFRYVCPGTNNPNSYDLWIDLQFKGKVYRISNWNSTVQAL